MKIYFGASLRGKREFGENYKNIANAVTKLGHTLLVSAVELSDPDLVSKETSDDAKDWYTKMIKWIDECDVALFEVSYPSLGIGHEVSVSLFRNKQVIALHVPKSRPYVLESIPSEKVQVLNYDLNNVENVLSDALEYAQSQLNTRFTMNLSSEIVGHLNSISDKGLSRSDYIRNLIKNDMEKSAK